VVTVARGAAVIAEGDAPDHLYVIRSGHLSVTKHGEQVATLVTDDWFGEIGLLQRVPRMATVRSASDAELWQISGAEFLAAVNESALPPAALLDGISNRLAQLDRIESPPTVLAASEVELAEAASHFTRRGVRHDGPPAIGDTHRGDGVVRRHHTSVT
jgi:CRP-like cAMP-binding protein